MNKTDRRLLVHFSSERSPPPPRALLVSIFILNVDETRLEVKKFVTFFSRKECCKF